MGGELGSQLIHVVVLPSPLCRSIVGIPLKKKQNKKLQNTKAWAPLEPLRGVTWDFHGGAGLALVVPRAGSDYCLSGRLPRASPGSVFSRCSPTYRCASSGVTSFWLFVLFHSFSPRGWREGGEPDAPPTAAPRREGGQGKRGEAGRWLGARLRKKRGRKAERGERPRAR